MELGRVHTAINDALVPPERHRWRRQVGVGVLPSMLYHVVSPLERLPAQIANVRPLRRVGQQVSVPHVRRAKVLLADVTRVRFDTRVRGRVGRQIPLRGEHLTAFLALVGSAVLLHVIAQILLRQQPLVAHVALELVLVQVCNFSVLVQRVVARVEFPTDVAHVL